MPLFSVNGCDLERCQGCGFAQVTERPDDGILGALYSAGYFESSKYADSDNQRRENDRRLALLERAGVSAGARVLDAGCATGDFIAAARGRYELYGIDLSADAVAGARARNPELADRIAAAPVDDVPFDAVRFDAICLWDVIEHLWDPAAAARRLVELLEPGGVLVLSTPDIGSLAAQLMGRRWAFMTPPEHLGFFSQRSLRELLVRRLDLEILASRVAGKWVNAGFLAHKLRRVFPDLVPGPLVSLVESSAVGRASLYVPTRDIRYVAARKSMVAA